MSDAETIAHLQQELETARTDLEMARDEIEVYQEEMDRANNACEEKDRNMGKLLAALECVQKMRTATNVSNADIADLKQKLNEAYTTYKKLS